MTTLCLFCGLETNVSSDVNDSNLKRAECPTCKKYMYRGNDTPEKYIQYLPTDEHAGWKLLGARENILADDQGYEVFWSSRSSPPMPDTVDAAIPKYYEDYRRVPIVHANKPDDILKGLAASLENQNPVELVPLDRKDLYRWRIQDDNEAFMWIQQLVGDSYLEAHGQVPGAGIGKWNFESERYVSSDARSGARRRTLLRVTPKGWMRVRELYQSPGIRVSFIAISFRHRGRLGIQRALEAACRMTGFEAKSVDEQKYNGSIPDRIIAEINRSRFVVAELTEMETSSRKFVANAGVYFEAGYAEGRGIPVIYCTQKKAIKDGIHFDRKHFNLVVYSTLEELTQRLTDRINATINR